MRDFYAEFFGERFHQRQRHGRASAQHSADRGHITAVLAQVAQHVAPDRGHRSGDRGALRLDEFD